MASTITTGQTSPYRSRTPSTSSFGSNDCQNTLKNVVAGLAPLGKSEARKESESVSRSLDVALEPAIAAVSGRATPDLLKPIPPITKKLISRLEDKEAEIADFQIIPVQAVHQRRLRHNTLPAPHSLQSGQEVVNRSQAPVGMNADEQCASSLHAHRNHNVASLSHSVPTSQNNGFKGRKHDGENNDSESSKDEISPSSKLDLTGGDQIGLRTKIQQKGLEKPQTPAEPDQDIEMTSNVDKNIDGTNQTSGNTSRPESLGAHPQCNPNQNVGLTPHFETPAAPVQPLNSLYRVAKQKHVSFQKSIDRTKRQNLVKNHVVTQGGLSEEDLLHMLMYHSRNREREDTEKQERQQELETRNRELRDNQADLRQELEVAIAERKKSEQRAEDVRNDFDRFQSKYKKLKNWALEMNNEYAAIRQEGHGLRAAVAQLQQQRTELQQPIKAALRSNALASTSIDNVKRELRDTRTMTESLNTKLKEADKLVTEKQAELRLLKTTESEHKSYIGELLRVQQRCDHGMAISQRRLAKALDDLSTKVDLVGNNTMALREFDKILPAIQEIADNDAVSSSHMQQFAQTIIGFGKQLEVLQENTRTTLQAANDPRAHTSFLQKFDNITEAISHLKPDIIEVQELRTSNVRLQTKMDRDIAVHRLLEEAKQFAEQRQAELQKDNGQLVDSITAIRENGERDSRLAAHEAQTKVAATLTKYDRAADELREVKTKLQTRERELMDLKKCLSDNEERYLASQRQVESEHRSAMMSEKESRDRFQQDLKSEMQNKVKQKSEEVFELNRLLQKGVKEYSDVVGQMNTARVNEEKVKQLLATTQSDLSKAVAELKKQTELHEQLAERCQRAQKLAGENSALKQSITEKESMIVDLQQSNSSLHGIRVESSRLQNKQQFAEETITELKKSVQAALQKCIDADGLQRRLDNQISHADTLQKKLAIAEKESALVEDLKKSMAEKEMEIKYVRNRLEDERKSHRILEEANSKNRTLEGRIMDLEERLSAATEQAKRAVKLEIMHQEHVDMIADLKKRALNTDQLEKDLITAKEQLAEKDAETEAQRTEVRRLTARLSSDVQPQQQTREDRFGGILIHNTCLSITSHDDGNRQVEPDYVTQTASADSSAHDGLTQVITRPVSTTIGQTKSSGNVSEEISTSHLQASVVPDTQLPLLSTLDDEPPVQLRECDMNTSSSLSEVNENYLDTDIEAEESASEAAEESKDEFTRFGKVDDIFDIPPASPHHATRYCRRKLSIRASTSLSPQDDMLLQASELGHQHSSPDSNLQRADVNKETKTLRSGQACPSKPAARNPRLNPSQSRANSQAEASCSGAVTAASEIANHRAASREQNRPNSAIKRRIDDADTGAAFNEKRLRLDSSRYKPRKSKEVEKASSRTANFPTNDLLPGSRGGGKRSKSNRKAPKLDKYASQFDDRER